MGWENEVLTDPCSANAGVGLYRDDEYSREVIDASDHIVDIREYDVPYHVRVAIDKGRPIFHFFQWAKE